MLEIPHYQRFFADLKRRRVFRAVAVYGAVAFGTIQGADIVLPRLGMPDWTVTLVVWVSIVGFPVAVLIAWAFERTSEGLRPAASGVPGARTGWSPHTTHIGSRGLRPVPEGPGGGRGTT